MSTPLNRPARPGARADSRPDAGAYGVEEDGSRRIVAPQRRRTTPLGWLPWAALAAIAALVLLSLLAINAVDDDGPDGPAGDALGQAEASDGSGINGQDGDGRVTADGSDATGSDGAGSDGAGSDGAGSDGAAAAPQGLTAGGRAGAVGQQASGTVAVESVVSDEGFWVGSGPEQRVFVYLTPQARQSSGESGFQVRAGQTVSLQGAIVAVGEIPEAVAGVEESEGLSQLRQQAALVRADQVSLAG